MALGSLLTLLDDIATVLDDVSVMAKVAVKKSSGVLGDDLALNAQQVTGVSPERELPVVWAVAKGSLINKAVLVPAALLISAIAPWAVTPASTRCAACATSGRYPMAWRHSRQPTARRPHEHRWATICCTLAGACRVRPGACRVRVRPGPGAGTLAVGATVLGT